MNKNIAFLVKDDTAYVDLHSISEVVEIPVTVLKGFMFDLDIDKENCARCNDDIYLNESAACELLSLIEEVCGKTECAEAFHIWLHDAFDRIHTGEPEDDADDCDDDEIEDETLDKIVELLQEVVPAVVALGKRVKALEEK